jgi:hypothetical protein
MAWNDSFTSVLLVTLFIATPLVFALSLYFQDKNRPNQFFRHSPKGGESSLTSSAHVHPGNHPPTSSGHGQS